MRSGRQLQNVSWLAWKFSFLFLAPIDANCERILVRWFQSNEFIENKYLIMNRERGKATISSESNWIHIVFACTFHWVYTLLSANCSSTLYTCMTSACAWQNTTGWNIKMYSNQNIWQASQNINLKTKNSTIRGSGFILALLPKPQFIKLIWEFMSDTT